MKRIGKIFAWTIAGIVVAFAALAVALSWWIDPNDYKQEIATVVKNHTGRDLEIVGDLALSVFPRLGVETGELRWANPPGFDETPMLSVRGVDVKVKLLPLLRKALVFDTAVVERPELHLIIDESGMRNWHGLGVEPDGGTAADTEGDAGITMTALADSGVVLDDGRVVWEDRRSGVTYTMTNVNLKTGSVLSGPSVVVALGFELAGGDMPEPVTVDAAAVVGVDSGDRVGLSDISVRARSDRTHARLEVADAEFGPKHAALELAETRAAVQLGAVAGQAHVPRAVVHLNEQTVEIPELVVTSGGLRARIEVSGSQVLTAPAFTGRIDVAPFDLRDWLQIAELEIDSADSSTLRVVTGASNFSATIDSFKLQDLRVKLDATRIDGSFDMTGISPPRYRFDFNVDHIDLDRYLPPPSADEESGREFAVPTSLLEGVKADGSLKIGEMKLSGVTVSDIHLDVDSQRGAVDVNSGNVR